MNCELKFKSKIKIFRIKVPFNYIVILAIVAFKVDAQGPNSDCPAICPLNYAPLCAKATDGTKHTFPNECTMKSENCRSNKGKFILDLILVML